MILIYSIVLYLTQSMIVFAKAVIVYNKVGVSELNYTILFDERC